MPLQPRAKPNSSPTYTYYYGPFRLESEVEIPELRDLAGPGKRRVVVRTGGVPKHLQNPLYAGDAVQLTQNEFLLNIPDTARYYVTNGNQVRVESVPGVPVSDVSTYLLGSVFGALCHQNGLLPLHASAVADSVSVTAFLGNSGAGKSTLAAWLNRRGHQIIADDICLLDASDAARPRVIPVAGWLKLWNQSLEHLGQQPDEQHRVFSADDKYRVFLPAADHAHGRLKRLVFLERAETPNARPELVPLSIPEAVAALMDMTYAAYIPVLTGQQSRIFRECAAVLRCARAYRLTRPWTLDRTEDVLDLLERELLTGMDRNR